MLITDLSDPACTKCKQHRGADEVCVMGQQLVDWGPDNQTAHIMVVTGRPNSKSFTERLAHQLEDAGFNTGLIHFTSAIKCRNWEANIGKTDIKACRSFLEDEVREVNPEWILVMGNEALQAVTGNSGIMKYRAREMIGKFPSGDRKVMATVSPASVSRNPGQMASYMADLRFFHTLAFPKMHQDRVPLPTIHYVLDMDMYKKMKRALARADLVSFDIETNATDTEFSKGAVMVSIALTLVIEDKVIVFSMPLYHPESPFRKSWRGAIKNLAPALTKVQKRIAHNGKYDCRWITRFAEHPTTFTFDTMLAAHLLDENREKGLKPQATSRLGVAPWGIETKDLLNRPMMEVLEYNALDTYYAYHIYRQIRAELIEQPRLLRIFTKITMPACNTLIFSEQRGIYVDRDKLRINGVKARQKLAALEEQLLEWVPHPNPDEEWGPWCQAVGWPLMGKRLKPAEVNFNASNWCRWWLFEYLEMPVLARGKDKEDGSPGMPSMAEDVMLQLQGSHPAVDIMLERAEWQKKVSAFFNSYDALLTEESRIHTTFKLAGTVTGRLSSGKEDRDKVNTKRAVRGVNLQQVPRDTLVRGLFGAAPGYAFVEADFSQVELRIAAFLSRDSRMLHLYRTGADIHRATAANVLGIPESEVTKDDRKKAKAVNFGFVYGMGWRKFIYTAFTKYQAIFTEDEAKAVRKAFFAEFPGLLRWHARQRRLVDQNRRVQNPLGRVRHLPDIDSPDQGVRGEAERQAINAPVQGFGSDLCVLSMNLINEKFDRRKLDAHVIGNVHDALLFEILIADLPKALPIIKRTMEHLPLERMFGLVLDVPIIAEVTYGKFWSETIEWEPGNDLVALS